MAGFLYCFNTVGDSRIYKVGHTQQDKLSERLKGYLGPSKPRVMVASRRVDDSVRAEALMLTLVRHSRVLTSRPDLGKEWFHAPDDDEAARHAALLFFSELVACAVATPLPEAAKHQHVLQRGEREEEEEKDMGSMGTYFAAFDHYVAHAPLLGKSLAQLMDAFDASDACPVFVDYLRHGRDARLRALARRHPLL